MKERGREGERRGGEQREGEGKEGKLKHHLHQFLTTPLVSYPGQLSLAILPG